VKYFALIAGHFVAPFAAHAFCNHMGFPDFAEILTYKEPQRMFLLSLLVLGLVAWCMLLTPLTNPAWYSNHLFWKNH
jgi:prenyl protein peptidase